MVMSGDGGPLVMVVVVVVDTASDRKAEQRVNKKIGGH